MTDASQPDNDATRNIAALEARVSEAQSVAEKLLNDTKQISKQLETVKHDAESIRGGVDVALGALGEKTAAIEQMLPRANQGLAQIEEAARKANSESGFALNARNNAEEHAKAISQLRGSVEVDVAAVTANKKSAEEIAQSLSASRGAAEADLKAISDSKAAAAGDAAQIRAASERVLAVMPSIDQGNKDANAITAAKSSAESAASALTALHAQIAEASAKATLDAATVNQASEEAKTLTASISDARTTAIEANDRLRSYEAEIKRLAGEYAATQKKLEGLLPHATSAGLASAFHIQKARFSKPQRNWLAVFVVTIIALLATALYGIPTSDETWDAIIRHFVNRLPLVAPLVWLAIYAGHHYNMALRMEEDYAFKEAVSTAFEGYKREMLAIPAPAGSAVSPLVTLCENVLRALAERPGRIYDGRNDVVTPLTPLTTTIKDTVAEVMKGKNTPTA